MAARGSEEVVILRPGQPDRYGDVGDPVEVGRLVNCVVIPRVSGETEDRGRVILSGYQIWAPETPGQVSPEATDQLQVRGEVHNVDGVPGDYRSKRGQRLGDMIYTLRSGS